MKIPKNPIKVKERLKKFLIFYYDLPERTYIDSVLKSWKKKFVLFLFDIFVNGFFISIAMFPIYYFFNIHWITILVNFPCFGVLAYLIKEGIKWNRKKSIK